jgi:hypothetical protein
MSSAAGGASFGIETVRSNAVTASLDLSISDPDYLARS